MKARLFQTFRREYENFAQKPGEPVEEMYGRFQVVINKLRANKSATDYFPTDHEQALMLLHMLDPKVWEVSMFGTDSTPRGTSHGAFRMELDRHVARLFARNEMNMRVYIGSGHWKA